MDDAAPRRARPQDHVRVRVWDGWVRLFHWGIVALLAFSWWTAETDRMAWHMLSGHAILALLLFRIAWGLVGSDTARFARFLRPPRAALRHLAHLRRRGAPEETTLGHNAVGGWMVLLMLGLLLAQAVTGLFADDEELHRGPLADWVGFDTAQRITGWHQRNFNLVLGAVALHVAAVAAYWLLARRNLIAPMITGVARVPADSAAAVRPPRMGRPARAAALLVAAAALVYGLMRSGGG
jgi:cytochrome b